MNIVKSKQISRYIVIAIALVLAFLVWNNHLLAGITPTNIGINNGKLAACLSTPNCVSSQAPENDVEHSIQPIQVGGKTSEIISDLKMVIQSLPRTKIVTKTKNYMYVEFSSKLMGFVDDVEFYLDDTSKVIQVRSASRLGESDFGVNRQRIEEIRSKVASLN